MNTLINKQNGTVMIISMVFLLLISLIASTAAETNTLQMQMAGNNQLRAHAQQRAMAMLDAILDDKNNTPVVGNIGYKVCAASSTDSSCDRAQINLSAAVTSNPSGTSSDYFVTRIGPLEIDAPVMEESMASSASAYNMAKYEVTASFNGDAARLGNSKIVQGVTIKIPAQNI
jgi:Tfp pilus assembly protein PilX